MKSLHILSGIGNGIGNITAGCDMTSPFISGGSGDIGTITVGRDLRSPIDTSGNITVMTVGRDYTGLELGVQSLQSLRVGRDLSVSINALINIGSIAAGANITSAVIHAGEGAIGSISAGTYSGIAGGWQDQATAWGNIAGGSIVADMTIGDVMAYAAPGYDAFISNETIRSGNGTLGNITAVSGISGTIEALGANSSIGTIATTYGDIKGNITATNGNISAITLSNGSLLANLTAGGSIGDLTISGNISGNITASNGNIGNMAARGNITSTITAGSNTSPADCSIGNIASGGSLTGSVTAQGSMGQLMVGTFGGSLSATLLARTGSIGSVYSFGAITQSITSAGTLTIDALGNISGNITADGNLTLFSTGNISGTINDGTGWVSIDSMGNLSATTTAQGKITEISAGNITGSATSQKGGITEQANGSIRTTATSKLMMDLLADGAITDSTFTSQTGVVGHAIGNVTNVKITSRTSERGSGGSTTTQTFNGNSGGGLTFAAGMALSARDFGGGYEYEFAEPGLGSGLNAVGGDIGSLGAGEALSLSESAISPFETLLLSEGAEIGAGAVVPGGAGWTVSTGAAAAGSGTGTALSATVGLPLVAIGAWYAVAKTYANYIGERATDSQYITNNNANTQIQLANQDKAYVRGVIDSAVNQALGGIQTQLTTQAVPVNASSWQQYEQAVRSLYGNQTSHQPFFAPDGSTNLADATAIIRGVRVAVEAKLVGPEGWAGSIYNPTSGTGIFPWGQQKVEGFIAQATDYSKSFDAVIYHSNNHELINYYNGVFSKLGLTNVKFIYSP